MEKKEWTITQLYSRMKLHLMECRTDLERQCCRAICGIEIREKANALHAAGKLKESEASIASQFGFRYQEG